jgi:hypothetical protein
MGLARSLRPDEGQSIGRPIGPAANKLERTFIARPNEKILPRIAFGVIERERELTRALRHDAQVGPLPV